MPCCGHARWVQGSSLSALCLRVCLRVCVMCVQVRHWADLAAAAGQLLAQTLFARRAGVHVMHVTSEMVPLAKVGRWLWRLVR